MTAHSIASWVVLALIVLSGCFSLDIADGTLKCKSDPRPCPEGYFCASDSYCYRNGHSPASDCPSGYQYDPSVGGGLPSECVPSAIGDMSAGGDDMSTDDMGSASNPDMTVACGRAGQACCGAPFTPCVTGTQCTASSMTCEANDVWVFGYDVNVSAGTIKPIGMHFDGAVWTIGTDLNATNGGQYAYSIWGSQPSNYWAVGDKGNIFEWNGSSWTVCSLAAACPASGVTSDFNSVFGVAAGDLWIGGTNTILHFEGSQWVTRTTGLPANTGAAAFWGLSSVDLWAVVGMQVGRWNGSTWTLDSSPSPVSAIWGAAKDDVWAVGIQNIRHWNGTMWSQPFAVDGQTNNAQLSSVSGSASDDVWAVGELHDGIKQRALPLGWSELEEYDATGVNQYTRRGLDSVEEAGMGSSRFRDLVLERNSVVIGLVVVRPEEVVAQRFRQCKSRAIGYRLASLRRRRRLAGDLLDQRNLSARIVELHAHLLRGRRQLVLAADEADAIGAVLRLEVDDLRHLILDEHAADRRRRQLAIVVLPHDQPPADGERRHQPTAHLARFAGAAHLGHADVAED